MILAPNTVCIKLHYVLRACALAAIALAASSGGCAATTARSPRQAIAAYADAALRGDADAIYSMMDERGQRALSRTEVRRMVSDEKAELIAQSKAISAPQVVIRSRARLRYTDGEDATLVADEQGLYRISTADALPAGAARQSRR